MADRVTAGLGPDRESVRAFADLDPASGNAANYLRYAGTREALVLRRGSVRQSWSRGALRNNQPPWRERAAGCGHIHKEHDDVRHSRRLGPVRGGH